MSKKDKEDDSQSFEVDKNEIPIFMRRITKEIRNMIIKTRKSLNCFKINRDKQKEPQEVKSTENNIDVSLPPKPTRRLAISL